MKKKKTRKHPAKQLFLSLSWFFILSATILISTAGYNFYYLAKNHFKRPINSEQIAKNIQKNNQNKNSGQEVETVVEAEDARAQLLANFLERYKSPMKPYDYYGQKLVEIADQYELDFRLLPAIAMQESNLCKVTNPGAPHNCLGFGIHSRGTLDFESYEAGFQRAGRELKKNYIDQGLETVELIETKYTPSSNGSWANSVNQWMAEIRYDDRGKGRTEKENANVLEFAIEKE
jgi:hypothetical protein